MNSMFLKIWFYLKNIYLYFCSLLAAKREQKTELIKLKSQYDSLFESYKKDRETLLKEIDSLKENREIALNKEWNYIRELQEKLDDTERISQEQKEENRRLESQYKRDLEKQIDALSLEMAKWKEEELGKAIKSSNVRSRSILRGKNAEHYVPFSDDFLEEFSPSDAKFIGNPIDYVIFKNASKITDKEEAEIEIIFADVKTGKSQLTKLQRCIKKAVQEGKIRWKTFELRNKNEL